MVYLFCSSLQYSWNNYRAVGCLWTFSRFCGQSISCFVQMLYIFMVICFMSGSFVTVLDILQSFCAAGVSL